MDRRFSNAISSLADRASRLRTLLAKYWRTRTALVDQGYRPELHYMRGPGPQWREAHARLREGVDRPSGTPTHLALAFVHLAPINVGVRLPQLGHLCRELICERGSWPRAVGAPAHDVGECVAGTSGGVRNGGRAGLAQCGRAD